MENRDIIEAMCQERDGLRNEMILMQKTMHQALLPFLAVAAGLIGAFGTELVNNGCCSVITAFMR